MRAVVVDTNVLATANGRAEHVGDKCVLSCITELRAIKRQDRVAIDDMGLIMEQYRRHCSYSGQPGMGDEFFLWLHERRAVPRCCETVQLRMRHAGADHDFEAFPDDEALAGFDHDDRVFVAVARASAYQPPILNAVDTAWATFLEALRRHGVEVEITCPEEWPILQEKG